jgi:hypothetical protein
MADAYAAYTTGSLHSALDKAVRFRAYSAQADMERYQVGGDPEELLAAFLQSSDFGLELWRFIRAKSQEVS